MVKPLTWTLGAALMLAACGGGEPESDVDAAPAAAEEATSPAGPIDVQLMQCTHTAAASIYGRQAEQWRAEYYGSEDIRNLNLTVWQFPTQNPAQFSFSVNQNGQQHRIDTVEGSQKVGSGMITITATEPGVQFKIVGKDQSGNDLRATISCNELIEPVAEGG